MAVRLERDLPAAEAARELAVNLDSSNAVVRYGAVLEVKRTVEVDLDQRAHVSLFGLAELALVVSARALTVEELIERLAQNLPRTADPRDRADVTAQPRARAAGQGHVQGPASCRRLHGCDGTPLGGRSPDSTSAGSAISLTALPMPLVLAQNESTESGHRYADELGVAYEYPTMYRKTIRSGRTVRLLPRTKAHRRRTPASGLSRLGRHRLDRPAIIRVDSLAQLRTSNPFRRRCPSSWGTSTSSRWARFRLAARDSTSARVFVGSARRPWCEFSPRPLQGIQNAGRRRHEAGMPWAPPETARLIDEISMDIAVDHLKIIYPGTAVERMPHNNPGYDIRIEESDRVLRYVEVKGTSRLLPHFFMSEGERLFSHDKAEQYSLLLVYGVDRTTRTGSVMIREAGSPVMTSASPPLSGKGRFATSPNPVSTTGRSRRPERRHARPNSRRNPKRRRALQ